MPVLQKEAVRFAERESMHDEPAMYGRTDGKAIGTYLEHKFQAALEAKYHFEAGSSAKGIDFPGLEVDMKVTSVKHPQSACPFRSARQKIYGLGYSILLFVYEKSDDPQTGTARLNIVRTAFLTFWTGEEMPTTCLPSSRTRTSRLTTFRPGTWLKSWFQTRPGADT